MFGYETRQEVIGAHHIRWPGSVTVEDGFATNGVVRNEIFDISTENLWTWDRSGNNREGLAEVMRSAVSNEQSFALTIPTSKYVAKLLAEVGVDSIVETVQGAGPETMAAILESEAVSELRHEVRLFMDRLLSGGFGDVPENFTVEVGTEYYATNVWAGLVGNKAIAGSAYAEEMTSIVQDHGRLLNGQEAASAFGIIFALIADEISDSQNLANLQGRNTEAVDVQIAVQLGALQRGYSFDSQQGSAANNSIFVSAFHQVGSFNAVDTVIWHRYVGSFESIAQTTFNGLTNQGDRTTFSLNDLVSAWDDGRDGPGVNLLAGWLAPGNQADVGQYGARSLNLILQQFTTLIHEGVDVATIWGTDGFGDGADIGSLGDGQKTYIGGKLFGLMTDVLAGSRAINSAELLSNHSFIKVNPGTVVDTPVNTDQVNTFSFENDSQTYLFLTCGDFGAAGNSPDTLTVKIELEGRFDYAWSTHLFDPRWESSPTMSAATEGVIQTNFQRGYSYSLEYAAGRTFLNVTFAEEFETIRLILTKSVSESNTGVSDDVVNRGSSAGDSLIGRSGNDHLWGDAGNDYIAGASGNDNIDGGSGSDTLVGGLGDDTYFIDATDILIETGIGIDTVVSNSVSLGLEDFSGIENFTYTGSLSRAITGNVLDNVLVGGNRGDTLYGLSGNDRLDGQDGVDTYYGGGGNDTFLLSDSSEMAFETTGNGIDTINFDPSGISSTQFQLPENIENLFGFGRQSLFLFGNELSNVIQGSNQSDSLYGGAGNDTFYGRAGEDIYFGGSGNDVCWAGDGDFFYEAQNAGVDTVFTLLSQLRLNLNVERLLYRGGSDFLGIGNGSDNMIGGFSGDDRLVGLEGHDVLYGAAGRDFLDGGSGNDAMFGGVGNDIYRVDSISDVVVERSAGGYDVVNSSVAYFRLSENIEALTFIVDSSILRGLGGFTGFGNALDNFITGGSRSDVLIGGGGNDRIYGGAGNDSLNGSNGSDTCYGGLGNDTYFSDNVRDIAVERGGQGFDSVSTVLNRFSNPSNIEEISFVGRGNFVGFGNALGNVIRGNNGNDSLFGRDGNDRLSGGFGNDRIEGGNGSDWALFEGHQSVVVNLSTQGVQNTGYGSDVLLGIENILGGSGQDLLTGSALSNFLISGDGNDRVDGGSGNDNLYGGDGRDRMIGGSGHDLVNGGSGNDILFGGSGNDALSGAAGSDVLYGGYGKDRFVYAGQAEVGDSIGDFVTGEDSFVLHVSGFRILRGGQLTTLSAGTLVDGNFSTSTTDGNDYFIFRTRDSTLWFDADGAGTQRSAVLIADLQGDASMSASDILLI